jgi:hypothetical protein
MRFSSEKGTLSASKISRSSDSDAEISARQKGIFEPFFWGKIGVLGPKMGEKWAKNEQKWTKMSIFKFFLKKVWKMRAEKWAKMRANNERKWEQKLLKNEQK